MSAPADKKSKSGKKRIMLVCGSGIVSSTLIMPPIEEILSECPYNCELIKGTFNDIPLKMKSGGLDLILTTVSPLPKSIEETGVPVVVVTQLFRGEKTEVSKEIREKLK